MSPSDSPPTRCDEGAESKKPVRVRQDEQLDLALTLCQAPFRVVAHFDESRIFDRTPVLDGVTITVPPQLLTPGLHSLHWAAFAPPPWKWKAEVLVDGELRFRNRKGNDSTFPHPDGFAVVEVTP